MNWLLYGGLLWVSVCVMASVVCGVIVALRWNKAISNRVSNWRQTGSSFRQALNESETFILMVGVAWCAPYFVPRYAVRRITGMIRTHVDKVLMQRLTSNTNNLRNEACRKNESSWEYIRIGFATYLGKTSSHVTARVSLKRLTQPGPIVDAWVVKLGEDLMRNGEGEIVFSFDDACQVADNVLVNGSTAIKPGYGDEGAYGASWRFTTGRASLGTEENRFQMMVPSAQGQAPYVACTIRPDSCVLRFGKWSSNDVMANDPKSVAPTDRFLSNLNTLIKMSESQIPESVKR